MLVILPSMVTSMMETLNLIGLSNITMVVTTDGRVTIDGNFYATGPRGAENSLNNTHYLILTLLFRVCYSCTLLRPCPCYASGRVSTNYAQFFKTGKKTYPK